MSLKIQVLGLDVELSEKQLQELKATHSTQVNYSGPKMPDIIHFQIQPGQGFEVSSLWKGSRQYPVGAEVTRSLFNAVASS